MLLAGVFFFSSSSSRLKRMAKHLYRRSKQKIAIISNMEKCRSYNSSSSSSTNLTNHNKVKENCTEKKMSRHKFILIKFYLKCKLPNLTQMETEMVWLESQFDWLTDDKSCDDGDGDGDGITSVVVVVWVCPTHKWYLIYLIYI